MSVVCICMCSCNVITSLVASASLAYLGVLLLYIRFILWTSIFLFTSRVITKLYFLMVLCSCAFFTTLLSRQNTGISCKNAISSLVSLSKIRYFIKQPIHRFQAPNTLRYSLQTILELPHRPSRGNLLNKSSAIVRKIALGSITE